MISLFLSLFILNFGTLHADEKFIPLSESECLDTDFSARMGPIGDRGETNFCHIFVAADLINVNQDLTGDRRVSRLDLASNLTVTDPAVFVRDLPRARSVSEEITRHQLHDRTKMMQFVQADYPTYMWGGLPDVDVMAINHRDGVCTEKDLPSQQSVAFRRRELYSRKKFNEVAREREDTLSRWQKLTACSTKSSAQNLMDFTLKFGRLIAEEADTKLRQPCKDKVHLKPMNAHVFELNETEGSRRVMSLFKRGIPAGIGYDHMMNHTDETNRDPSHASTVAGAKWNKKKGMCEFKIRESNGLDCSNILSTRNCKDGEFWVEDKVFSAMITHLFYIDPQVTQTSELTN